jgi:hypothetical protein
LPDNLFGPEERQAFYAGYSNDEWTKEHVATLEQSVDFIRKQKEVAKIFKKKTWFGS